MNWALQLIGVIYFILITSTDRINFMSQSSQHMGHSGGPLLEAQNGLVRPTATGNKCNVSEPILNDLRARHHAAQDALIGVSEEEREERKRKKIRQRIRLV